jgi:hypothetical protein
MATAAEIARAQVDRAIALFNATADEMNLGPDASRVKGGFRFALVKAVRHSGEAALEDAVRAYLPRNQREDALTTLSGILAEAKQAGRD